MLKKEDQLPTLSDRISDQLAPSRIGSFEQSHVLPINGLDHFTNQPDPIVEAVKPELKLIIVQSQAQPAHLETIISTSSIHKQVFNPDRIDT